MDINEKNPPRPEGAAEGNQPRENPNRDGKRPPARGNNYRRSNGNRPYNNRPNTPHTGAPREAQNDRPAEQANDHFPANGTNESAANPRPNSNRGGNPPADGQRRPPQGRNHPHNNRRPQGPNDRQTAPGGQSAAVPETASSAPNPPDRDRPQRNSTGRPQRVTRRPNAPAELPDMDNLLIEDYNESEAVRAETVRTEEAPDAAELERILESDIFADSINYPLPDEIPEGKVVIAGVRFRSGGKTYFFDPGDLSCEVGQYAIVETARGQEFGEICIRNCLMDKSMVVPPLRPVLRIATEADIAHNKENHAREEAAYPIGIQKIAEHGLDMKLVSVQYTFDNAKLLFYYTSAGRVDFRELVKDLAGVFHVRIELRQIGIRDEARMIGGLGACGRPLCCTTFLSDFGQVSMKMAKEQNLSLNSTKISGCCGRLMCCLRYEYETYTQEIRKTPAQGSFVNTPDGPGVVTEIFPLQGEVKVSLRNQSETAPRRYKREDVVVQARAPRSEQSAADSAMEEPDSEPDSEV